MLILGCGASLQILRQRRPSRVQIHKSIVSFLWQLHLLSQRVAKRLKIYLFINLCTYTHTHTHIYIYVHAYIFILHMVILYASLASKPNSLKFQTPPHPVYARNGRFRPNFFQAPIYFSTRVKRLDVLLGTMSSIRREVRRCFDATGWSSRE